ncbi:macrophage mannose receptor 1-like isoform X2 [Mugil cephalus]|uniref:macrophage mannose receptor 1-like isoform X2 n=1 Tax=Mugil cephalus TaxID=48193 RepID=UPI001FB5A30C|nr:macrophage mannose receptor 1-like isoform X2 [Mugil cephalus]
MVQQQRVFPFIGILLWFLRITTQLAPEQYHLINESLTWYEAQSFCRLKYTDLATVNNMDDQKRLVNTLGSHVTNTWIGLQKGGYARWMWSDGSGLAAFIKWNQDEPNNHGEQERCAEMSNTSLWNDVSCLDIQDFVCYERRDGKKRFVYYTSKRNWVDSQELCRAKYIDLAYIGSEGDNSQVFSLAKWVDASMTTTWIGLFKDSWYWSDGRETSFRYWLTGRPGLGNCSAVAWTQQKRWVAAVCDNKVTFLCEGGLKLRKKFIRVTVHSDVDLNDFTATDVLLTKLEINLRQQGVTDIKLGWQGDKHGLIFQRQKQMRVSGRQK